MYRLASIEQVSKAARELTHTCAEALARREQKNDEMVGISTALIESFPIPFAEQTEFTPLLRIVK